MPTPPPIPPQPGQNYLGPPPPIAPPPKGKKPFYKRWWFIVLAVFFGFAFIGSLLPPVEPTAGTEPATVAEADAPDPDEAADETAVAEEEPAPPAEPEFQVGTEFRLGDYSYVIDGATSRAAITSAIDETRASAGATFIVVQYRIRNEGNETETAMTDDFQLVDGRGREFRSSSNATTALMMSGESEDFLITELQPGIWRQTMTAFEVPEDAVSSLTLVIPEKGVFGSDEARITLSL